MPQPEVPSCKNSQLQCGMWYRLKGDHLTELTHARTSKLKIYEKAWKEHAKRCQKWSKLLILLKLLDIHTKPMAHGFQMLRHTRLLHEMRVYFQNLKFQYVKNYPYWKTAKKKCQTPANHQNHKKSYNQILQKPPDHIPDRETHGKCKVTEVFKWKFLKLWTFSDTGAAGYIYCQFTNLPSGQFATETTCHAPTCLPGIYWNHLSCTNLPARYMSVTTTFGSNALCQVGGKTTVSDGFENRLTSCACLTEPFAATSWVLNRW